MTQREVHLRDYLAVINKHLFTVVATFILIFGSALAMSLYMPKTYQATALIEVQSTATNAPSALPDIVQNIFSNSVDYTLMETICKRLVSESLLSAMRKGVTDKNPHLSETLPPLSVLPSRIKAEIVQGTSLIKISVRLKDYEGGARACQLVANELIRVLQDSLSKKKNSKIAAQLRIIDEELKSVEEQFAKSRLELSEFISNNGDSSIWAAEINHLLTRWMALLSAKEEAEGRLSTTKLLIAEISKKLVTEPELLEYSKTITNDPLWEKYQIDLSDIEVRIVGAKTKFGDQASELKELQAQKDEIESKMRRLLSSSISSVSAKTEIRNPTYQKLLELKVDSEINLTSHESQLKTVRELLEKFEKEKQELFAKLPQKQFELSQLQASIEMQGDIFKTLYEKKVGLEILSGEAADTGKIASEVKGGIEVVDAANLKESPVSPRVLFICAVALVVGLAVGITLAFAVEYFDNTYQSPEEAKDDLDLTLLGSIPIIIQLKNSKKFEESQATEDVGVVMLRYPASVAAESYRTISTNLEFSCLNLQSKSFLVTSSEPGEGKSITVANLAAAIAFAKKEGVIILDCDMRKPTQHKIFELSNEFGLSNLIMENRDLESVMQKTEIPNLSLISCGPIPPNPVELLRSTKMSAILKEIKAGGILICDSPPVLPVADSLILAAQLDGYILVADLKKTPQDTIRKAKDRLSQSGSTSIGLVCNRAKIESRSGYYYYAKDSQ
jgi:capsular exopolysaccharide synthesis family protein